MDSVPPEPHKLATQKPQQATDPVALASLAEQIRERSLIRGSFRLRSGQISGEYFDKYQFESDPALLRMICAALRSLLPQGDVLAGLELGGIPIATVLSQQTGIPVCFVRKESKQYGTCRLAEGAPIENRRLIIVEDVITSGGQVAKSTEALRKLGAVVSHAICVVDRESGGAERLREIDVQLIPLFHASDLR